MDAKRDPRPALVSRGAQFWDEDGRTMFRYVIDPGSVVGPQPAKAQDQHDHPEAWGAYQASKVSVNESNSAEVVSLESVPDVASEAASGPTPKRRGPGRPRKKSAGHDASDHDPKRL